MMSELNAFQLWCKEILPIVQAAAEGEAVEFQTSDGTWHPRIDLGVPRLLADTQYRIKPKIINVNGFDVPAPMCTYPEEGSIYWVVSLLNHDGLCANYKWKGDPIDELYFYRGLCHSTDTAATAHAEALLGIDPNKE